GELIDRAIKKADFVFVTSLILAERINQKKGKDVFYLPNGVDFNFFQKADRNLPREYINVKGKKVIYIGAIDYWFYPVNASKFLLEIVEIHLYF
ncbi:unnamed protein product, partial [marine sediment metagenome]